MIGVFEICSKYSDDPNHECSKQQRQEKKRMSSRRIRIVSDFMHDIRSDYNTPFFMSSFLINAKQTSHETNEERRSSFKWWPYDDIHCTNQRTDDSIPTIIPNNYPQVENFIRKKKTTKFVSIFWQSYSQWQQISA